MSEAEVRELLQPCTNLVGGIIHACRRLMKEFGYISADQKRILSDIFNLSVAEVSGIISFYHDFKTTPQPPNTLRICTAEACQANRSRDLIKAVESHLGSTIPCQTVDGMTAVSFVYCLGLCPNGPAVEINGQILSNASTEQVLSHL
ncbi:MAG: NAD(P)H-dependent oxidoreductase subunit E [Gammaproteobacteria bacterium]|nr:NAD(P)H-dependent oxidoreductase subunit E [Gammaproteobacteria bacterium]